METLKNWIVKKLLVEVVGKAIAKADGKRTWIGSAILGLLLVAKYGLPVFFSMPPLVMDGIDQLLPIVSGATITFASIKTQKAWEAAKKVGDEMMSKTEIAPVVETK